MSLRMRVRECKRMRTQLQIKHVGQGDENMTSETAKNVKILLGLEHQGVCQEMGLYADLFESQGHFLAVT